MAKYHVFLSYYKYNSAGFAILRHSKPVCFFWFFCLFYLSKSLESSEKWMDFCFSGIFSVWVGDLLFLQFQLAFYFNHREVFDTNRYSIFTQWKKQYWLLLGFYYRLLVLPKPSPATFRFLPIKKSNSKVSTDSKPIQFPHPKLTLTVISNSASPNQIMAWVIWCLQVKNRCSWY